ncbi:hypothetical protein ANN_21876 [Periplaneta americana]|uniref:Uncharacterized protein n=1 Tax=Periplaneta americana TaxID=6978 RepID=A0ABQ8S7F8_PERAM|nr:hypothetical protein ANN_21876 [Periplaneta americana]
MAGLCEGGNESLGSLKATGNEFQSLGRAIVKEDEHEEVRWDGIVSIVSWRERVFRLWWEERMSSEISPVREESGRPKGYLDLAARLESSGFEEEEEEEEEEETVFGGSFSQGPPFQLSSVYSHLFIGNREIASHDAPRATLKTHSQ